MRMSALTLTDQKFLSLDLSSLWKLSPGLRGIQLEVKRCGLDRSLLVPVESREAISEGIGDEKIHPTLAFRPRGDALASSSERVPATSTMGSVH